jgi:hypothetical protein
MIRLNFIILVMDSHYDYSPQAPKNLTTALIISKFFVVLNNSKTKRISKSALILPVINGIPMSLRVALHLILD